MSGLFQAWHSKFLHYFFSVTQHMLLLGDGYHCANFFGSLEHKLVLSSHFVHVALGDAFFPCQNNLLQEQNLGLMKVHVMPTVIKF